ncbi:hypothetical protein Q5P01_011810 [Channa striata]|uniref:LRAT domain-containing protein n=1 Tax=Channa striata TaxID=64152 RepID=A0AA88MU34_CHASR|nr:hypothetical protein Q5P01_011810 [Channa striata]
MKSLIFVSLLLLLLIRVKATEENYQFGDIIAFQHEKKCSCKSALFKHYAIYVGGETLDGKAPDQDIFHRTGPFRRVSGCVFGKLSEEGRHFKDNFLDGAKGFTAGDHRAILGRIRDMKENCKRYNVFTNNCEHLVTFVRYGKKISVQHGTVAGFLWKIFRFVRGSDRHVIKISPDYEDVSCKRLCPRRAIGKVN